MSGEPVSFSLSFPAQAEYLGLCRLAVAALAGLAGLDEELVDDLKLAVTEACTNTIQHAYRDCDPGRVELRYEVEAGLVRITIEDSGVGRTDEAPVETRGEREGGMGLAIIRSLVDELELEPRPGGLGTRVTLARRL